MKLKPYCDKVIFWPQYGPICWFNAVLIAVFYSQSSRNMLYQMSNNWDMKIEFYKILRFVLKHKYLRSKTPEKDYKFFDIMRPENILQMIHKINPKYATENMWTHGSKSNIIISKLYKLLGASCLMFELGENKENIYYDRRNHLTLFKKKEKGVFIYQEKNKTADYIRNKLNRLKTPDVLIINTPDTPLDMSFYKYKPQYKLPYNDNTRQLQSLQNNIQYNGEDYVLDSVIISNYNKPIIGKGHAIAGISCNNERYVYNGWTRYTQDTTMQLANAENHVQQRPCELMKFDWSTLGNNEFCINLYECKLPKKTVGEENKNLCFSFAKGDRTLVYIKKTLSEIVVHHDDVPDYKSYNSKMSSKTQEKITACDDDKIKNPATNRCISKETAVKKNLIKSFVIQRSVTNLKITKVCPEGKVLNPKTNRCVKIKADNKPKSKASVKVCPEGKVLNPKTNRCVKIKADNKSKSKASVKVCPEGKVLNPKTNRCVKIKADNKPKSKASVKVCPEGKVLNPKTNRCVKIKADNKPKKQRVNNK
jgi:hypothetical protein